MHPRRRRLPRAYRALCALIALGLALVALSLTPATPARAAGVIYVRPGGTGTGTSWPKAFGSLQSALNAAVIGDEIWVAAGRYTPGALRSESFLLRSGLAIYGGFAGSETLREQRDWAANPVILSGDLLGDDGPGFANSGENSYHVVTGASNATLDGVTISGGNANAGAYPNHAGGGMFNYFSSPTLRNITFSGNQATYGGGLYNYYSSSPSMSNITFSGNSATYGGGLQNYNSSSPTLSSVTFSGNSATNGGGMYNSYTSNPTLSDVSFSANSAASGGGINNSYSSPTLSDVSFSANSAINGGGMYSDSSSPRLSDVSFSGNSASASGGALFNTSSHPSLSNVNLSGNSANAGGGIYNAVSNPSLSAVVLSDNRATTNGGGMYNAYSSRPTLDNVTFSGNSAASGGGMSNTTSSPRLTNVTFSANSATAGGGMANASSSPTLSNIIFSGNSATAGGGMYNSSLGFPLLSNIIFSGNTATSRGGGMYNGAISPSLVNITISANSAPIGGGMYNDNNSSPSIRNSIIWGNAAPGGPEIFNDATSTPSVSYSLVEGGYAGAGNLSDDPLFVSPVPAAPSTGGDLRLQAASPAINAGENSGLAATDLAGGPRIVGGTVDMGAYEVQFPSVVRITRAGPSPTNAASVDFTVSFNMPVSGAQISDLSLTTTGGQGGAFIARLSVGGSAWAVGVTTADAAAGTIRLDLADTDNIYTNDALRIPLGGVGLGNGAFMTGEVYTIDRQAPIASISSASASPTSSSPIPVTVSFSEDVSGFDASDLRVSNASVGGFAGGGASYSFDLTPTRAGLVTVDIAAGAAADLVGNPSLAADPLSRSYAPAPSPGSTVYLPLALTPPALPDLVVTALDTSGGQLRVTIANRGAGPTNDGFWVDLLIAPRRAPTQVNDTWDALGARGLSWGVTTPLAAGEQLTLTVGDASYRAAYSNPGGAIGAGTLLYAHVDAVNTNSSYGGVLETHERDGGAYNNILGPTRAAATVNLTALAAAPAAAPPGGLPPR